MASIDRGIVLAATPLGNPRDASDHLRCLLAAADVIAAEDTRRLRALAGRLGVKPGGRVVSLFDHNERSRTARLVEAAAQGLVAVVSDAGAPLISDPGFDLVRAAIAAGIRVSCAPGPSAVVAALMVSGLPADRFAFEGFAPRAAGPRAAWLDALAGETRTVVAFDSPRRVAATLRAAAQRLGPDRPACLARELTKPHEEILRGSLGQLADLAARRDLLGEVTLVLGGAPGPAGADLAAQVAQVERLVAAGDRVKDAVALVAGAHASPNRALYQAVLAARAAPQRPEAPGGGRQAAGGGRRAATA
ncbi:MAG: 16S rRNA (cytidine(1402)-2'-O)-methyltransferase [Bifidobacteriaceae bacterium]|jgi:16S rRNA (cytidine1402-2'-O)-methyltransferase|nr:16S rRNA (cytidine(1402)-2'-O)-methyltransferase [Bifidobacteriaceae bacterium]